MSFLLQKDESLLTPSTDLSSLLNKKDSILDRDDNPLLEVVFKKIELDPEDCIAPLSPPATGDGNASGANDKQPIQSNSCDQLLSDNGGAGADDNTPKKKSPTSKHDFSTFRVTCACEDCMKYRETIIQLFLEDFEYNTLWKRLQVLIRRFYDIVPDHMQPSSTTHSAITMYGRNLTWISDGRLIDTKKNIQLSLGSNLPLSNDMTFILVFSMLYRRDPHQLFELLCLQLRSIAISYSEGFKNIIKPKCSGAEDPDKPTYDPVELINFILDGYDKVCNAAKSLSPLLFELQRGHLQKFSLTWNLLNKRIYQRWVYWGVKELIPECILKLKTLLDTERYKSMVYRFIKFDDEMTLLTFKWREIWTLLNTYHLENDDIERRKRMCAVHEILKSIKQTKFEIDDKQFADSKQHTISWLTMDDRKTVWTYTIYYLRSRWLECPDPRLQAGIANVQCLKCNYAPATHYVDCVCRTCILAGGPCFTKLKENTKQFYCTKCTVFEKIDRDYLDCVTEFINTKSDEANKKVRLVYQLKDTETLPLDNVIDPSFESYNDHNYHLSWALFKHLSSRRPYNAPNFVVDHFCSFQVPPCVRNECRVATQIIAGLYPLNFSKFLISAYQPLNEEERKGLMNIHHLYLTYLIRKLCNDNSTTWGQYNMSEVLLDVDDTDYALLCDIGSAFAECYLTDSPIPLGEALNACFICENYDIELDMYWLESLYASKEDDDEDDDSPSASPSRRKGIEEDPKLKELKEIGAHMDKFFSDKSSLHKALIKQEDIIKMAPSVLNEVCEFTTELIKPTSTIAVERATTVAAAAAAVAAASTIDKCPTVPMVSPTEPDIVMTTTTATAPTATVAAPATTVAANKTTETRSGDHLAEAIKLAVNQKLNLQLEEELRTLKEEHRVTDPSQAKTLEYPTSICDRSVLKDMVRDLEQMKENEEKQIKTTTEKNGHQCCSEHSEFLENHPNKMCHRGDGQCSCYYCTIFGHTECNHGRTNETRDRLRKRLHQQHSKDTIKSPARSTAAAAATVIPTAGPSRNAKGLFLKSTPSTSTVSNTTQATLAAAASAAAAIATNNKTSSTMTSANNLLKNHFPAKPYTPTPSPSSSVSSGCSSSTASLSSSSSSAIPNNKVQPSSGTKRKLLPPIVQQTQNILVNNAGSGGASNHTISNEKVATRKEVVLTLKDGQIRTERITLKPTVVQPPAKIVKPVFTEHAAFCNIDDLLEFIEGNPTSKHNSQKKAAKKAKQKQKKQDIKKVEDLEQMRDDFHEIFYKESFAKTELKTLKNAKKKDKKKILEAENMVKKMSKSRATIESTILEFITELKRNNGEFKFAYLPTKEQQLEKQKNLKESNSGTATAPVNTAEATTSSGPVVAPPRNIMQQQYQQSTIGDTDAQQKQYGGNCEVSTDPSKRMVTIRRVNMPHSDPQVTVTAKGPSPDKDKLLYTFINGQLVAGVSVDPATLQSQSISQIQQYHLQHQQLRQQNLNAALNNAAAAAAAEAAATAASQPQPTVSNMKNDKIDKKLKKQLNKQGSSDSVGGNATATKVSTNKSTTSNDHVNNFLSSSNVAASAPNSRKNKHDKKQNDRSKAGSRKESIDENCSVDTNSTVKSKSDTTNAKGKTRTNDKDVETLVKLTKDLRIKNEPAKAEEKRKVKAPKFEYADPQYKNNKFDVLDMDGDDYYISEEESIASNTSPNVATAMHSENSKLTNLLSKKPITNNKSVPTIGATTAVTTTPIVPPPNITTKPIESTANVGGTIKSAKKSKVMPVLSTSTIQKKEQKPSMVSGNSVRGIKPSVLPPPAVPMVELSKKQKKKLAQQQLKQEARNAQSGPSIHRSSNPMVEKSVVKAENMAKSLKDSMQRLNLNDDTTIELVRENHGQGDDGNMVNPSVSIMDQLNRGIKVEGLMLPPGITLTRVDPIHAEQVRAKKESIERVCHPMPPVAPEPKQPHLIMSNPMNGQMMPPINIGQDPNGFIMVDTSAISNSKLQQQKQVADAAAKKNKKSRRKNKNKKDGEMNTYSNGPSNGQTPKLVTLRNPLFNQQGNDPRKQPPPGLMNAGARQLPLNIDQPAAIIKNENGMFTIRNPALHHALSQSIPNNGNVMKVPPYGPSDHHPPGMPTGHHHLQQQQQQQQLPASLHYGTQQQQQQQQQQLPHQSVSHHNMMQQPDNFSFFSDNMMSSASSNGTVPKTTTAIGSEIKNAQQQRKQQLAWQSQQQAACVSGTNANNMNGDIFNHLTNLNPQQSYTSASPALSDYSFNSDFIGASSVPQSVQQPLSVSSFYNGNGPFTSYSNGPATSNDRSYLFGGGSSSSNGASHRCDDSPPLSSTNNYYEGISQSYNKNYDDMTFLHNLQPGQRLNSEVTIHNISESKFLREQPQAPLTNGVEITRIPCQPSAAQLQQQQQQLQQQLHQHQLQQMSNHHPYPSDANLAVGSHRHHRAGAATTGETLHNEFGDSIFAPNQTVNLSELESEERDIESFKRFDYYFKPPVNKPKVNFDVKNIVLAKKPASSSDSSSPYLSETASMNGGTTPSLDDLYNEMASLKMSASNLCDIVGGGGVQHNLIGRNIFTGGSSDDIGLIGSGAGLIGADHYLHGMIDGGELKSGLVD